MRARMRALALTTAVVAALVASCGTPATDEPEPAVSVTPESLAPTTAAPGPCTWTLEADEPAAEDPSAGPSGTASHDSSPDVAPHQGENDQWRQRADLTAAQVAAGRAVAEQVQPVLVGACEQGDFSPERLADALAVADGWTVFTIQPRSAMGDPSTGVVFTLENAGTCLAGDTVPGRVQVRVTGPIADGGCWEPPSS